MARLDSNAAWKDAVALVAANREVFLILAGVFFFLPSMIVSLFAGEPTVPPGASGTRVMEAATAFYAEHWWLILLVSLAQVVGVLATLALMRDRRRPTVGEAIRAGGAGLLPYLVAQLLFGLALGLVAMVVLGLAGATGAPPVVAMALIAVGAFAMFVFVRTILLAPVVALEGERNPVAALRRSWRLTEGNGWRIFGFLVLVAVLYLVVMAVIMMIVGLILALLTGGEVQRTLAAAVSSALTALAVLYFVGILAAIHRQLAGPEAGTMGAAFE